MCEWEYTRTWRKHYIDDDGFNCYDGDGPHGHLLEICSSAPYSQIQGKYGYDLYYKGKFILHGKKVKELKKFAEEKYNE